MMRGYKQRCRERLERLRRRVDFLSSRIASHTEIDCRHDQAERSAVLWAIEEIERWDLVADVLLSAESAEEKIRRLETVLRSRLRPSESDLDRTPALARQWRPAEAQEGSLI